MNISSSNQMVSENFVMKEFYSKSSDAPNSHYLDEQLINAAQAIRTWSGVPVRITSSYRTQTHNDGLTGASKSSQHLVGRAIDLQFVQENVYWIQELGYQMKYGGDLAELLSEIGITGYGYYDTFVHIDTRLTYPDGNEIALGDFHVFGGVDAIAEEGLAQAVGSVSNVKKIFFGLVLLGTFGTLG